MSKKKESLKPYVAVVLDKSGSMASTKEQTIQGYNEQVQQIKKNAKDQEVFVSLVTFSGDVFEHFWNEPADKLQEANAEDYVPDGTTSMRDAIGYTVQKLSKTAEKDSNNAFLVIVISDGATNDDKHVSREALRELIEGRQKQGNWTFTYMGCGRDVVERVARETSIPIANMALWENHTVKGTKRAMRRTGENVAKYLSARGISGASATCNFASDKDMCLADYTSDDGCVDAIVPPIGGTPSILPDLDNIAKPAAWQPMDIHANKVVSVSHAPGYFATGSSVSWEG